MPVVTKADRLRTTINRFRYTTELAVGTLTVEQSVLLVWWGGYLQAMLNHAGYLSGEQIDNAIALALDAMKGNDIVLVDVSE